VNSSEIDTQHSRPITLPQGEVWYRDVGMGPPIVFIHGLFLNGNIWKDVVAGLRNHRRCIVPELPLGAHTCPMNPNADLSPAGTAKLISDFLEALNLRDVTIVGLDFGGVVAQLVAARFNTHVSKLVLTNCDALEVFPAKGFGYLKWLPRLPGAMWVLGKLMYHVGALRLHKTSFAVFAKHPIPDKQLLEWVQPLAQSRGIRHDVKKMLRGISTSLTLSLPSEIRRTGIPTLLAWGTEDTVFSLDLADRLRTAIGNNAHLVEIPGAKTFVPFDAPQQLAATIATFTARQTTPS